MTTTPAAQAYDAFRHHRFFAYRGCAPDTDHPTRAAGDLNLPVTAWEPPDVDGAEDQGVRRRREAAAIAVCKTCPVLDACRTYALSPTEDGSHLAEEQKVILGGLRSLERHRMHIRTRHAEADRRLRTPQKQAVLRALAAHTDPYTVAAAAGLDVRTSNWQRSVIVALLGLDKQTTTRQQVLEAAAKAGLLDGVTVVPGDDVLAVPPPTPATPAPALPVQVQVELPTPPPATGGDETHPQPAGHRPIRIPGPRRGRFTDIRGQLTLDDATDSPRRLRLVPTTPTTTRLERAA